MNPSLDQALNLLAAYNVRLLHAELVSLQPGQPKAQAYDTDRTSSGQGPSDPTFNAATTPNTAAADLAKYQRYVDNLYAACLGLARLADRHLPTHEPRKGTIVADTRGCALHERAGIEEHHPARVTTDFASVLDTPLREPIPVCHACQDFVRRSVPARLPTNEELVRHTRTGKWVQRTTGKRATVLSVADVASTRPEQVA